MRNMADRWDGARKEVTCFVCSKLFVEPKILPCLHTFCKKCLQEIWEGSPATERMHHQTTADDETQSFELKQNQSRVVSTMDGSASKELECPSCDEKFMLTLATIDTLPINAAALRLTELVTTYKRLNKEAPPSCQLCENNSKAVSSCLQCDEFLCTSCEFAHKRLKLTRTHQINCLDDIKSGRVDFNSMLDHKQEFCSVHPDKYLELFCKDENCLICLGCAVAKHRDHQYGFISQVVEEQRQHIREIFPDIERNIDQLAQARAEVEAMQEAIKNRRKENIEKIKDAFAKLNTVLAKRKQQLLDEVNEDSEKRISSLNAQQKQLDTLHQQMTNFLTLTTEMVESRRNKTILDINNPVIERSKSLTTEKDQTNLKPSQSVPSDIEFYTLDSLIRLVDQMAAFPCPERCAVNKTAYNKFKLTLKDAMNKPILGSADLINVFSSSTSVSDYITVAEDASSVTLQVVDAGNGEYTVSNVYDSHCSFCYKPFNQFQNQTVSFSDQSWSQREPADQLDYQPSSPMYVYCSHCYKSTTPTWYQYVSVFFNKRYILQGPFN